MCGEYGGSDVSIIYSILDTTLARKAVETSLVLRNGQPCAANFLRDLLEEVDKMATSCQMNEFTEHGLPHLLSLVQRIQAWTKGDGTLLLDSLSHDETFLLLFAILSHDVGMLAQREDDLDDADRVKHARVFADLPLWVRRTHVERLEGIIRRSLRNAYAEFLDSRLFSLGVSLARSHQYWPGEYGYCELEPLAIEAGFCPSRVKAMAGVLAVADLLDEDSGRCDTMTLFANKAGNLMNRAHWLRHLLTYEALRVEQGVITVRIRVPTNLAGRIDNALEGLKNHLRLAQAYNTVLETLNAGIRLFFPGIDIQDSVPEHPSLQMLLCEPDVHLMRTLPDIALPSAVEGEPSGTPVTYLNITLVTVDRSVFDKALGPGGSRSGRSDLEITYAAASARGDHSGRALNLLQNAALEAFMRGDLSTVRRLCSLVLANVSGQGRLDPSQAFWALVLSVHLASHEHDLTSVEHVLYRRFGPEEGLPKKQQIKRYGEGWPLEWHVLALTTQLLLMRRHVMPSEFVDVIKRRLELSDSPFSLEEQIAWHDLAESFWALGYFQDESAIECLTAFRELQRLESALCRPSQLLLSELGWRMAVQSSCLQGYGRWEAPACSRSRNEYSLLPDPAREAVSGLWIAWFHGTSDEQKQAARQARKSNPPGTELYLAALEAEWLVSSTEMGASLSDDDGLHRRLEYRDAVERDEAAALINGSVTALLDASMEPKKEGTIYLGSRGAEVVRYEAILGERMSLRRWCLGTWHKVVGYNLRTTLSLARTMYLEGDRTVRPVLDAIQDLPWGAPYSGKSKKLLDDLMPRLEPFITTEDLAPIVNAISRSPRRIGNIRHQGLLVLGDAITSDMLPTLIEWTIRELSDRDSRWPPSFEIWPHLLEHADLSSESWQALSPLLEYAYRRMIPRENAKIVQSAVTHAPWSIAGPLVARFAADYTSGINTDWAEAAKSAICNALLSRGSRDWLDTNEHKQLMDALKHSMTSNQDRDARILIEFLGKPSPAEGHESIAEQWLEHLEFVRDRALARKDNGSISYGMKGYARGPSRAVNDEMAERAAMALKQLWAANYPTLEEIEDGTDVAGYLFRASQGAGRDMLAQSLLGVMDTACEAVGHFTFERSSCAHVAWQRIANHSSHFPSDCLPMLMELLIKHLTNLPLQVVWTQTRFAVEVLVRSESFNDQQLAKSALMAIRARTIEHPLRGAEALVAGVRRLLEEKEWVPRLGPVLDLFVSWADGASVVPNPDTRKAVARVCSRLSERVSGQSRDNLTAILARLAKDVRMRVRNETSNRQAGGQPD